MKATSRLATIVTAGLLALAPVGAGAQDAQSNSVSNDVVGPRELEDFSLPGTRTRPAETQPPAAPAPTPDRTAPNPVPDAAPRTSAQRPPATREAPAEPSRDQTRAQASVSPRAAEGPVPTPPPIASAPEAGPVLPEPADSQAPPPPRAWGLLVWLLPALLLAALGWFMLRRRASPALAGGPETELEFQAAPAASAPPAMTPEPVSTPPVRPSAPVGVVSTRLRPWIDVAIQPIRCTLDAQQFTVEVELEIFNSGSAPARAVLAEAVLIPGGSQQDQQIAAFFNRTAAAGGRLESLSPLDRTVVRNQLIARHDQLQPVDIGGRQVIVPVVALDVRFQWSGGEGQTAAAWLVSRDTGGERLAPIRMDLLPRVYRTLAGRALPISIRR